jgi:uroporphyrinogen-III decarboxylase
VPYLFAEGGYNERLEFLTDPDIPEGRVIWIFDQTDMVNAKKVLGGKACFGGNVPASMLKVGTPQQVEDYVKFLIENVGQDGGFMLTNGAVIEDAKPENLHAMINTALKYGQY